MQQKFAHELVSNEGRKYGYQCAIDAGYAKDRARQTAWELQNPKMHPLVVKYIGELREERLKKYEVNYASHVAELGRIKDAALKKGAWSAAVNADAQDRPKSETGSLQANFILRGDGTTSTM